MIRFRVHLGKTKAYYVVRIFDTPRQFREWDRRFMGLLGEMPNYGEIGEVGEVLAVAHGYSKYKNDKLLDEIGTMVFIKKNLGVGIVAHEIAHAVTFSIKGKRDQLKVFAKGNEGFAQIIGNMNAEFWHKWYDSKKRKRLRTMTLGKQTRIL